MTDKIHLLRPYFNQDEMEEIRKVLDSGWVAQGPKAKELEEGVAAHVGVPHAVAVTNCTAALHLALLSVGVERGDEVLVADYTYPATGHSVAYCGAKPVFVDIDRQTYNMDPALIPDKVTDRTKAVIPVHTFGQPARMDDIMQIARENDLAVIEDAACAFGARYRGRQAGSMGDAGCYSFHARKGITTGEGGMLVTGDLALARRARKLSVFGITGAWEREGDEFFVPEFTEFGYNYKMSDITAAVGVAQLRKLDEIIEKKRALARVWNDLLEPLEHIQAPYEDPDTKHIYQSYVALVEKGMDRNGLIVALEARGVQAQIGTYASHIQPVYKSEDRCPKSREIFERAIALPMYYTLSEEEVKTAADQLALALEELA